MNNHKLVLTKERVYPEALSHKIFEYITKAADNLAIETYAVGGFVRDFFLHRPTNDIDIVAVGNGIELAKEVSRLLPENPDVQVFKNYGTAMIRAFDLEVEFVGARKESYSHHSRKPAVKPGTLEDDQNRRDFTINALALQVNKAHFGELIDPFGGIEHLEKGLLKTPLQPEETYSDDPLRMMRAIRFATQLNFKIERESLKAITENAKRIQIISEERIVDELHKIILAKKPSKGFALLRKTKLLPFILPELSDLEGVEEVEGQRHKDNFWHTLEVLDNISRHTDNLWLRWAALLHDIGKAPTKRFDKKIGWTFHGHEFIGAKMVYKLFKRLKMPLNWKMKYVQKLVYMSSRPIVIAEENVTDSAVRRLIYDAGDDIEDLMTLCEADITTKNPRRFKKYHNNFKIVRKKIVEVEERDQLRNFQPPISGEEIMTAFNLKPSREVGAIKNAIKEAILQGKIPNEYEAARDFMIKKGTEMGLEIQNEA
ncbi:MAG TPA: HD domain-containing protein [Flavobacteriaceae bacterium]|nr:HD domain-containing protein [Flavobacteriaceae bacterium]